MAKKADKALGIEPEAYYTVEVSRRIVFEGVGFGTLSHTEVKGELLARLLASDYAAVVTDYVKRD